MHGTYIKILKKYIKIKWQFMLFHSKAKVFGAYLQPPNTHTNSTSCIKRSGFHRSAQTTLPNNIIFPARVAKHPTRLPQLNGL